MLLGGQIMFKKLLYSFMIFIALGSTILAGYRIFEPKKNIREAVISTNTKFMVEYEQANQFALSAGDSSTTYFLFCKLDNDNCNYIETTLYPDLNATLENKKMEDIIEYVDLDNIDDKKIIETISNDWGISNYPAFVSVSVIDNKLVINNSLVWSDDKPLNTLDILSWLSQNNIYKGEVVEQVTLP